MKMVIMKMATSMLMVVVGTMCVLLPLRFGSREWLLSFIGLLLVVGGTIINSKEIIKNG